jgi:hypothetical protein
MVNSLPPPFTPHTRQISHVLTGDVYTHLICFGSMRLFRMATRRSGTLHAGYTMYNLPSGRRIEGISRKTRLEGLCEKLAQSTRLHTLQ